MSWRNDLQALLAQIELQQDALIPKLKPKQFLELSNLAHEKRSELYDLLGPDAFQAFGTMCRLWRLSHIKNNALELLQQHGELTPEQLEKLEEINNG